MSGRGQEVGMKRSRFTEENRPCVAIGGEPRACDGRQWSAWRKVLLHRGKRSGSTPETYRRWIRQYRRATADRRLVEGRRGGHGLDADLNALSFLDYLRDHAVTSKKQVFFATADSRIAALFTRKFSFLGDDFKRIDACSPPKHHLGDLKSTDHYS